MWKPRITLCDTVIYGQPLAKLSEQRLKIIALPLGLVVRQAVAKVDK